MTDKITMTMDLDLAGAAVVALNILAIREKTAADDIKISSLIKADAKDLADRFEAAYMAGKIVKSQVDDYAAGNYVRLEGEEEFHKILMAFFFPAPTDGDRGLGYLKLDDGRTVWTVDVSEVKLESEVLA